MPVLLISRLLGRDNVILISVHANAAGRGDRWYDATGWCAYTSRGDTRADVLATCLYEAAKFHLHGLAFYAISNSDGKIGTRLNRL